MYSNSRGHGAPEAGHSVRYGPQSTDDGLWPPAIPASPRKRPNYRPTPLRWYFILAQILCLTALMGVVVWARFEMPNSDSTAIVEHKRWLGRDGPGEFAAAIQTPTDPMPPPKATSLPSSKLDSDADLFARQEEDGDDDEDLLMTSIIVSEVSKTVTRPGMTGKITKSVVSTVYETLTSVHTSIQDGKTYTSLIETAVPTTVTTRIVYTASAQTSQTVIVGTTVGTMTFGGAATGTEPMTEVYTEVFSSEFTFTTDVVVTGGGETRTESRVETVTEYGTQVFTSGGKTFWSTEIVTNPVISSVPTVVYTTQGPTTFIEVGKVTITSVYTRDKKEPPGGKKPSAKKPSAKPRPSAIKVVSVEPEQTIKEVKDKGPVTIVTQVDEVKTVVRSQAPQTIVAEVGGYETTVAVVTLGADGLLTTAEVVSTVAGLLSTVTSVPGPTKVLTTVSGKLTTLTSTGGETTLVSTQNATTKTIASTVTGTELEVEPTGNSVNKTQVFEITEGGYFVGKFLPAMVSVILSIPLRVIDLNAQQFQPFYAMNADYGALGSSSVTLHYGGWAGFVKPLGTLSEGHPVPFLTMLVVWASALMTPLATEAVGVKIHGKCKLMVAEGCAPALGVSPFPTYALLAVMGATVILLLAVLHHLHRGETGLYANPWNIVGIASLAANREIRPRGTAEKGIKKEMADRRYGFGYFQNRDGETDYGIVLYDDASKALHQRSNSDSSSSSDPIGADEVDLREPRKGPSMPFIELTYAWRFAFMLFLLGLMIFILYYHVTPDKESDFYDFMNGQTFGIRFLFAGVGVALSFGWMALFVSVAIITPYQVMSKDAQFAVDSVLLTRPTNCFSGFYSAMKHGHLFLALVAFMTILSEFMPILLANVPYTLTQTYRAHIVCARLSIGILLSMVLTLIGSMFVRWPDMPVDPRSVAGAMYYVGESSLPDHFAGLARVKKKERERRVRELGGRYWFGEVVGSSGETRTGVEREDGSLAGDGMRSRQRSRSNGMQVDTAYWGHQL